VLQVVEEPVPEPAAGAVRVRTLAAGVSFADLLLREGVHPETPRGPITLGWDVVGVVDALGTGVTGVNPASTVAALPVMGGYSEYICLPSDQLVAVPEGLDPAEAVALVLNYVTAYQMLHRCAQVRPGQRLLIHGAGGGIGTALLQLARLVVDVTLYATASERSHEAVAKLGGIPIDYHRVDFVDEIRRLTDDGVDTAFDGIGGSHVWDSFRTLRHGGTVVAYGLTSSLERGRLAGGLRHRFRGLPLIALYMIAAACLPGRRRVRPYSVQRLMRRQPEWFRDDLAALFELLRMARIEPRIAARVPLAEAARAHELLADGAVPGKIVLICGDGE
jgi:NADPH2:quinone reductase